MAAGGSKDENRTSFTAPFYKKIKTTNTVAAQPETANTVDPLPFRWTIDSFSQKNAREIYSDVFEVGGYKWRVLIFPKGNNVMDYLHMYLCTADSAITQHQFNKLQTSRGFVNFIPLGELFDPSRGYLVNDTLVVEVEATCNVDEKDTTEHLWERLKKDQEVKEHKNKEKAEAHLNTFIKVVRDEDLAEQIGKHIYFDLVDHDKMGIFRVQNQTSLNDFKEQVAIVFGIPAQFQRFWLWRKRANYTYRPFRPLTHIEEAGPVGQFRDAYYDHIVELELFLEVERGLDLRPIAPLKKTNDDILLFLKLYDPEKEELRYVGRLFVKCTGKPSEILTRLNELAGFDPDQEIELYEEIKFVPNVMCLTVEKELTFQESQLENGDIICFQKASAIDTEKHIRYPDVPSYLEYVRNRFLDVASYLECMHNRQVPFFPSETESEDEESFEEQNKNIMVKETNVDKNTEAQQSKVDIETTHVEDTSKSNTSKLRSIDLEEIDAMIDEDVIAAIDKVLSEGITLSLKSHHSVQGEEVRKLDPNLPEQLLQEMRDIAFKEDLVENFKEGHSPKVNFNAVKEKIDANSDVFSPHQLEQVGAVVNLLNSIVRMFEKLENLKKEQDSAKKSTDQKNEALKEIRQKILSSKTSFTDQQTQLNSLDTQIADLKAKLEKLQGDRAKIAEMQDQEKDKITSLNKEVKSIFHRLADDQIKLKSVEDKIPEAQTELESHEKLYRNFRAVPPF